MASMDATNDFRSCAMNGASFTDILTIGDFDKFLETQCVANHIPKGTLTSSHAFAALEACHAEIELLPREQLENLGPRATFCGLPANVVDGQLNLARPFSRSEIKLMLLKKVISPKDLNRESTIQSDIESERGGGSADAETAMKSTPAARTAQEAKTTGVERRAPVVTARDMHDLTATNATYNKATSSLWGLAGRYPALTAALEEMYGPTVEPDQRSIVLPDAFRQYIGNQALGAKLLRNCLKATEQRADGSAPWLTSVVASLDESLVDETLAREVALKTVDPKLSKYQLVYGGFGEGFLMAQLVRAAWRKIVTTHGETLVSAFRQLAFSGPGGVLDAAGASRRIELLIADAKRNSTPIDYGLLVRALASRMSYTVGLPVPAGDVSIWRVAVEKALKMIEDAGGVNTAAGFANLCGIIREVGREQDLAAGRLAAGRNLDTHVAAASVSFVSGMNLSEGWDHEWGADGGWYGQDSDDYETWPDQAWGGRDQWADQSWERRPWVGAAFTSGPRCFVPTCTHPPTKSSNWCCYTGLYNPTSWVCPECNLISPADRERCTHYRWSGCPGLRVNGKKPQLEPGGRHYENGQRALRAYEELKQADQLRGKGKGKGKGYIASGHQGRERLQIGAGSYGSSTWQGRGSN